MLRRKDDERLHMGKEEKRCFTHEIANDEKTNLDPSSGIHLRISYTRHPKLKQIL